MIKINLLSDREAIRKETSRQQISIFMLSICLVLVILGGIHFYQYREKKELEQRIQYVNQELAELKKQVGEVEKYKAAKKELETKLDIIQRLEKGKMLVVKLLDGVAQTIPEKMWLDQLELKGGSLSMEGYAIDNETIAAFMKELEATRSFTTVELVQTEQKEVEGVGMKRFSLVAAMAPSKAEAEAPGAAKVSPAPAGKGRKSP